MQEASIQFKLGIIIPTYNEAAYFAHDEYRQFLSTTENCMLCFVNDCSTDNTLDILSALKSDFPQQVAIVNQEQNKGKAESVRHGMQYSIDNINAKYLAYLDADLATSLEECYSMTDKLSNEIDFCFGSRILIVGSTITRKWSRFLVGRVIATIISSILPIRIYDTQCGCKLFNKELGETLFSEKFISKWLFDVELFFRYIKHVGVDQSTKSMLEIPLKKWIDRGDSKVSMLYFFKLWLDLIKIYRRYK